MRIALQTERDEKTDVQAKLDRLDSDNPKLSIKYDIMDAELIGERKLSKTVRESRRRQVSRLTATTRV